MAGGAFRVLGLGVGSILASAAPAAELPEVNLSGLVEVEAARSEEFGGAGRSDITLATVELALDAHLAERVDAQVVLLYEEDESDSPVVDQGTITLGLGKGFALTAGRTYVPFGKFHNHMVSDPLTLELAETSESLVMLGMEGETAFLSAYGFKGDSEKAGAGDDTHLAWGLDLDITGQATGFGVSYISNLADSDALQGVDGGGPAVPGSVGAFVGGASAYLTWSIGPVSFAAEHVQALDDFEPGDFNGALSAPARPAASHLEAALDLGGEVILAAASQRTRDAAFLGFPESRASVSLGMGLLEASRLTLEYGDSGDYGSADGGTGERARHFVAQLAVEF